MKDKLAKIRLEAIEKIKNAKSMETHTTDDAVIALLESMPHVETLNYTNGLSYQEDLRKSK